MCINGPVEAYRALPRWKLRDLTRVHVEVRHGGPQVEETAVVRTLAANAPSAAKSCTKIAPKEAATVLHSVAFIYTHRYDPLVIPGATYVGLIERDIPPHTPARDRISTHVVHTLSSHLATFQESQLEATNVVVRAIAMIVAPPQAARDVPSYW